MNMAMFFSTHPGAYLFGNVHSDRLKSLLAACRKDNRFSLPLAAGKPKLNLTFNQYIIVIITMILLLLLLLLLIIIIIIILLLIILVIVIIVLVQLLIIMFIMYSSPALAV